MVKNVLLPVLVFLFHTGYSQTTFQKAYGGNSDEFNRKVLKTADGGYLLAGSSVSYASSGLPDCYIVKTDAAGVIQWAKTYGDANWKDFIDDIIQTSDGGYAFAGTAQEPVSLATKILFCKMDAAGNILYQKSYVYTTWEVAYKIIQTGDGGYIIAADSRVNGQYYDIVMIKLDATGTVQWSKAIDGTVNLFEFKPALVHQAPDGGYVVIGSYIDMTTQDQDPLAFKLDSAGNEVWKYHYQGPNLDYIKAATYVPGQGYFLAGNNFNSNYDCLLMKIGNDGSLIWSQSYGTPTPYEEFLAIEYAGGEKILISGKADDDGFQLNPYFTGFLVDTAGAIIWQKKYTGLSTDIQVTGNSVAIADDGGYVFASAGFTGFSSWNMYAVKTDANGNSGCYDDTIALSPYNYPLTATSYTGQLNISAPSSPLSWSTGSGGNVITYCEYIDSIPTGSNENMYSSESISVYPNPATEEIKIENLKFKVEAFEIYNSLGENIFERQTINNKPQTISIDVSHLESGIYFLKIYFNDKGIALKKIHVINVR